MIEIPNTKRGKGIVFVKGRWYAQYWRDGKVSRAVLIATTEEEAIKARNSFYAGLIIHQKATVKKGRTTQDKLSDKPDLYIYYRRPFYVAIKGLVIGEAKTKKEAREIRDKYLEGREV